MISSVPLFPPSPAFLSGKQNPQPDGTFTLVANDDTGSVFSVQGGKLSEAPAGSASVNEKMTLNVGGGSVSIYASDGLEYCYKYDGRVA